jgi:hypothetical protein
MARKLILEPNSIASNADTSLEIREVATTDRALPILTKLRRDRLEDIVKKSRILIDDPNLALFITDNADPHLMQFRRLADEPKFKKSSKDMEEDALTQEISEQAEPILM